MVAIKRSDVMPSVSALCRQLVLVCRSGRPITSLIVLAVSATCLHFGTDGAASYIWSTFRCIPIALISIVWYISNDVFDFDRDQADDRGRAISTGALGKRSAWQAVIILSGIAIVGEVLWGDLGSVLVILATSAASIAYTPLAHRFPIIKGTLVGLINCAPFVYGAGLAGTRYPLFVYCIVCVASLGREIVLDVGDLASDEAYGMRTIASCLGARPALCVGYSLMCISLSCILLFCVKWHCVVLVGIGMCAVVASLIETYVLNRVSIEITKVSLLSIGIVLATMCSR